MLDFFLFLDYSIRELGHETGEEQPPNPNKQEKQSLEVSPSLAHPNGAFVLTNSPPPDFKRHEQTISARSRIFSLLASASSPSPLLSSPEIKIPLQQQQQLIFNATLAIVTTTHPLQPNHCSVLLCFLPSSPVCFLNPNPAQNRTLASVPMGGDSRLSH